MEEPSTESAYVGEVVPMPTKPAFVMRYASVPAAVFAINIGWVDVLFCRTRSAAGESTPMPILPVACWMTN